MMHTGSGSAGVCVEGSAGAQSGRHTDMHGPSDAVPDMVVVHIKEIQRAHRKKHIAGCT